MPCELLTASDRGINGGKFAWGDPAGCSSAGDNNVSYAWTHSRRKSIPTLVFRDRLAFLVGRPVPIPTGDISRRRFNLAPAGSRLTATFAADVQGTTVTPPP